MRLLIVDDEIISREGILRNLRGKNLGIEQIEQADDGLNALSVAEAFKPDIVLTDVRMPRMDGIEMSFEMRKRFPCCSIIFMSGYSDKEYLKSAIQLKAIRYVEKPIDFSELSEAITEAVAACREEQKRQTEIHTRERLAKSVPLLKNEIALQMIKGTNRPEYLNECLELLHMNIPAHSQIITGLVSLFPAHTFSASHPIPREEITSHIERIIEGKGMKGICGFKDEEHFLFHLCCSPAESSRLDRSSLQELFLLFREVFSHFHFFIALGKRVQGVENIPESYNTAVLASQKAFFNGYGSVTFYEDSHLPPYEFRDSFYQEFSDAIAAENRVQAVFLLKKLSSEVKHHPNTLVNPIKEVFFRIVLELSKRAQAQGLNTLPGDDDGNKLWELFSTFHTFNDLEEFTLKKLEAFFDSLEDRSSNKGVIYKIMKFIQANYQNKELSVREISKYTFLSLSYMCSFFKQETGKTVNQYLVDFRVEKAKELLRDKKYKVSDIATCVGFNDGQYFAKIFKKSTGLTPSEYREKHLL